jgi:GDP-L-fucose synthase
MKILLTGSSGMVGRNLLEHPSISNFQILTPSSSELDLRDFINLEKYLNKNKPELIIHAAGKVGGIQANILNPVNFFLENFDMGRNIVWASRKANIKKLINLASSCIYPVNSVSPLKEEFILKGELESTNEGYALAKITTLRLCEYINRENQNFNYKSLIPCNLFGLYDNFDPSESHLIPGIIHKVHQAKERKEKIVEIWGNGLARREFMSANDFADALMKAITSFDSLPKIMNIGLGFDYTVNEYYQIAAKVIGFNGNFTYNLKKPVGVERKLLSIDKQKIWGWHAKSDLLNSIEMTYKYYLKKIRNEF